MKREYSVTGAISAAAQSSKCSTKSSTICEMKIIGTLLDSLFNICAIEPVLFIFVLQILSYTIVIDIHLGI